MNRRRLIPNLLHAWLLAMLLLGAQALGLAHRVAHGLGGSVAAVQKAWSGDHEAGGAECRLVDQLAHADALSSNPAPAAAVPAALTAEVDGAASSLPQAAPAAYRARAPPQA